VHKDTGGLYEHLTVYSCGEDNVVSCWDAQTLTCTGELLLDISPDFHQPSSASADTAVSLDPSPSPGGTRPFVACKGLDGVLYVGDREGSVQQWDVETHSCLGLQTAHASSVRALAVLHKVPFQHSLVLSGSDDGTICAWKNSMLVASEKEGMRIDAERRAKEEQQKKRRAKESLDLERQRLKNELARRKLEEDESVARGSVQRVPAAGMQPGEHKWTDWNFFDGYLSHRSRMSEVCFWSTGHVHGLQCGFKREAETRIAKAEKHAVDLGKAMPTANLQALKDDEDITAVHYIVSESSCKGVVGQVRF
jgi:hypothetical protein